jgi:hypothetical protein
MDQRLFHLRSYSAHETDSNELASLDLELDVEGSWQPIEFSTMMPPFRAFACTALMCQHAYLRMNATERNLVLNEAWGEFWMTTDDWAVRDVTAYFKLTLRSGAASAEDLAFVAQRLKDCPISRNLLEAGKETTLEVVSLE